MAKKPTDTELQILLVLWRRGPSTVRQVHEQINRERSLGYTSVLKLLQIMTEKGHVKRNKEQRAHIYEAVEPAEKTKRQLATDVLNRVFEGSASEMMMHALADRPASRGELSEIRRLIDDFGEAEGK